MKPSLVRTCCMLGVLVHPFLSFAQSSFNFNIQQPTTNAVVGNQMFVQVAISSTYELQTVTVSVGTQSAALVFSSAVSAWTGTLSLSNLVWGVKTVTISATDVFGNSAQAQTTVLKDLPPSLTVIEPLVGTVARPSFQISVSATDDAPAGPVISVYAGSTLLATGTNNINSVASLPDNGGQALSLRFDAVDSAGQTNTAWRTVYVLSNTNWQEVAEVEGPIMDVSTNTILFLDGNVLKTKSRISGAETMLLDDTNIVPGTAALTPLGALLDTANPNATAQVVYEIRNGVLTNLGLGYSVSVQGDCASWLVSSATLILRDLVAGTNATVSNLAVSGFKSLAANGDLVYVSETFKYGNNLLMRYRNGTNSVLVNGDYSYYYNIVQTDGRNVVYLRNVFGAGPGWQIYSVFFDGVNELTLSTNIITLGQPTVPPVISEGWVAYQVPGSGGSSQLWTRSPTGVQAQQTFFGTTSTIQALGPNGQLLFVNSENLYEALAGKAPLDLGAWNFAGGASTFWQQGRWYMSLGRSLFVLTPPLLFTSATLAGTSQVRLVLNGNAGDTIVTQVSTNLMDWSSIATNTVPVSGTFQVFDTVNSGAQRTFYRAFATGY